MSEYREIRGSLQGERCEHKSWVDLCERCEIDRLRAENERLRVYALKAFTVVEFCSGQGFLLQYPSYDCDDLLMEGVDLLNVETSEEARAALEEK